jgi:hypothetical protein
MYSYSYTFISAEAVEDGEEGREGEGGMGALEERKGEPGREEWASGVGPWEGE